MPSNRTKRTRGWRGIDLDESIIDYFFCGGKPDRNSLAWALYVDRDGILDGCTGEVARAAWHQHRRSIMRLWNASGRTGQPWALGAFEGIDHAE